MTSSRRSSSTYNDGSANNTVSTPMLNIILSVAELALIAGIAFSIKYTISHRSGLNDPDKLERIWSRSLEIRYQPVYRALLFASCVSIGAPNIILTVLLLAANLLGMRPGVGAAITMLLGVIVVFVGIAIGPIAYKASGGTRKWASITTVLGANLINTYAVSTIAYQDVSENPPPGTDPKGLLIGFIVAPLIILGLQVPFALWGASFNLPNAARDFSLGQVNSVGIGRNIAIAAAPLSLVSVFILYISPLLDPFSYFDRVVSSLAGVTLLLLAGFASILSVNRAILSEDFRWQWRSFLTPAVPLIVGDVMKSLIGIARSNESPATLLVLPASFCSYGSMGYLGAHLYLYWASKRANAGGYQEFPDENEQ